MDDGYDTDPDNSSGTWPYKPCHDDEGIVVDTSCSLCDRLAQCWTSKWTQLLESCATDFFQAHPAVSHNWLASLITRCDSFEHWYHEMQKYNTPTTRRQNDMWQRIAILTCRIYHVPELFDLSCVITHGLKVYPKINSKGTFLDFGEIHEHSHYQIVPAD